MRTEGIFTPETESEARDRYAAVGTTAQTTVREVAKAMDFGREEYDDRVTSTVVETAREAIFASFLSVHVGTREAFEDWHDNHPEYDRELIGNENVEGIVWHPAPFADTVVAATYQDREEAAIGTLRRQAFGSVYRDVVTDAE